MLVFEKYIYFEIQAIFESDKLEINCWVVEKYAVCS